jgi:hypothetical protein
VRKHDRLTVLSISIALTLLFYISSCSVNKLDYTTSANAAVNNRKPVERTVPNIKLDKDAEEAIRMMNLAKREMPDIVIPYDESIFIYRIMKQGTQWRVFRRPNPKDARSCYVEDGEYEVVIKDGEFIADLNGGNSVVLIRNNLNCPGEYKIFNEKGERVKCMVDADEADICEKITPPAHPLQDEEKVREIYRMAVKAAPRIGEHENGLYKPYVLKRGNEWWVYPHMSWEDIRSCKASGDNGLMVIIENGKVKKIIEGEYLSYYYIENNFTSKTNPDLYDEFGKRASPLPTIEEGFFGKRNCWKAYRRH